MSAKRQQIYFAGGFGLSSGRLLRSPVDKCFIDTSNANNIDDLDPSMTYKIPGVNGAGQNRREIYAAVLPHIDPIVELHAPGDFNIIVFSASGGSGSVIGPLLARKLMKEGYAVVVIVLGDLSTTKYINNTNDTLKSLEAMALNLQTPVVMSYHKNESGIPHSVINEEVQFNIETLLELTNQENNDIDIEDIRNWLAFNRVTTITPQLAALTIYDNRQQALMAMQPITALTLYANRDEYDTIGNPMYSKNGCPREPLAASHDLLHFVVDTVSIEPITKDVADAKAAQHQRTSSYTRRAAIVSSRDDNITGEDIVLN